MSSHSLKATTALGGHEARTDTIGKITIAEITDFALASLAMRSGQDKAFTNSAKKRFKTNLPEPGKSSSKGDFTLFWVGPEQWFVEAPETTNENISSILKNEFGESASITEQSGGWCRFDVEGTNSLSLFERLCAVDAASMNNDDVTRTVMEHIGVFLMCRETRTKFSVYGPRSSAAALHHALVAAAESIA